MNDMIHRRASGDHILDIYVPDEDMYTNFILISDIRPPAAEPSKTVGIEVRKKTDGRWILQFILLDKTYIELFQRFFEDILESSRTLKDPKKGPAYIISRYLQWKKLFSPGINKKSESEIRGILGETLFLRDVLLDKYGSETALNAWMVSKRGKQDFVFEDTWYEIKTKTSDKNSIKISSISQLDSEYPGVLVVINLTPSSTNSMDSITVSRVYESLLESISNERDRELFSELMSEYICPGNNYEEYSYITSDIQCYTVDSGFPALRRRDIPSAVKDAEYELKLDEIKKYMRQ